MIWRSSSSSGRSTHFIDTRDDARGVSTTVFAVHHAAIEITGAACAPYATWRQLPTAPNQTCFWSPSDDPERVVVWAESVGPHVGELPAALMARRTHPSRDRKIVPIADAAERRRRAALRKSLRDMRDAAENLADEPDGSSSFTMMGNMALIGHAFADAIAPFSRALSLAPDDVKARAGRGRAYAALGEHALAFADFERAAALAPDEPMYHLGRANALARLGHMDAAVAAASCAVEVAPQHAGAHYTRAVYRSHVDPDDPGVRADLDRTAELAPHQVPYLLERADYLMDRQEYDSALGDIERALAIAPDDAKLHYLRAKCLTGPLPFRWNASTQQQEFEDEEQPRCEAALVSLERALALAPRDGELYGDIHYALVGTRELMRDQDAYLATLDQALGVMPDEVVLLLLRRDCRRRRGDLDGAESDRKRMVELGSQEPD
jgi:tetratricopeptide (TPR) repeat protein